MKILVAHEVADILGVSKKTLERWDKSGYVKAGRDKISNSKIYDEQKILRLKKWRELLDTQKKIYAESKDHVEKMITLTPEEWQTYYDDWQKRLKNNIEERKEILGL